MTDLTGPGLQSDNLGVERRAREDRRRRSHTPMCRKATPGSPRRTNGNALQTTVVPPERADGRLTPGSRLGRN